MDQNGPSLLEVNRGQRGIDGLSLGDAMWWALNTDP